MGTLIIEGPDLAGKTTLLKQISARLIEQRQLFTFRHFGLLPSWWNYSTDYIDSLKPYRMPNEGLLIDRFVDSEFVYGKLFRGDVNSLFNQQNQAIVGRCMERVKTHVIYCSVTEQTIKARFAKEGDEAFKLEQILKARAGYEAFYRPGNTPNLKHWANVPIHEVITDTPVSDEQIDLFCSWVGEEQGVKHD